LPEVALNFESLLPTKWRKLTCYFAGSRLSFLTPELRERSFSGENHFSSWPSTVQQKL
jgi:hypothetical protein